MDEQSGQFFLVYAGPDCVYMIGPFNNPHDANLYAHGISWANDGEYLHLGLFDNEPDAVVTATAYKHNGKIIKPIRL